MSEWSLERALLRSGLVPRLSRARRPILRAHIAALARRTVGGERLPTGQHGLALGILQARRRRQHQ